ncbi:soluble guanylate cyclase 88E-like [Tigriopus californicus]|uniref:soluble guanylate cyclase 88E-like n=1 Tax=Tigriopus californicus TaxID=6832 RepID=UPI0027DAB005|nr:soluble guanylate cyclase 88E-like [Tigriopus californicus]
MYGLIIENVLGYLRANFHPKMVEDIILSAKLPFERAEIDKVYPEGYIPKIGKKASLLLSTPEQDIFEGVGVYFVNVAEQLGYRQTVLSIAREFREFIMNLDNCHDYFKLTFTKMRAPSFFVDREHEKGLTLYYRSKRRGFSYYVLGQMKQLAKVYFNIDLKIKIQRQEVIFDTISVSYLLEFDNSAFVVNQQNMTLRQEASLPIRAHVIFEIFPFSILLSESLVITLVGTSLRQIIPDCIGMPLSNCFTLVRPLVEFNADQFMQKTNNVFVFQSLIPAQRTARSRQIKLTTEDDALKNFDDDVDLDRLQIRGCLMFMSMWKKILFIGCPIIDNLPNLVRNGLFINDLSMHDYSRDIMITSSQYLMEERMTRQLLLTNDQILEKMEDKITDLEKEEEERLCQLIPPKLLHKLIQEKFPMVSKLDSVPILIARIEDVEGMTRDAKSDDFVDLVDNIKKVFEHLIENTKTFYIQTIENFMAIADFTGDYPPNAQADSIGMLALELQNAANEAFKDPIGIGTKLSLSVAISTGPVVAAVMGDKVPKFGLFGSTVHRAEELVEGCPPNKIVVDAPTKKALPGTFKVFESAIESDNPIFILDEKLDYVPTPIIPILQAYTAFKASKNRYNDQAKAKMEQDLEETELRLREQSKLMSSCGGFHTKSNVCNLI